MGLEIIMHQEVIEKLEDLKYDLYLEGWLPQIMFSIRGINETKVSWFFLLANNSASILHLNSLIDNVESTSKELEEVD